MENVAVFPTPASSEGEENRIETKRTKDNDGLHKRRGIWHFKLKVAGRWKEMSTHTSNYQGARKYRNKMVQDQEAGRLPNDLAKWTFARAAEQWLEARKKLVGRGTCRIDKQRLVPLKEAFGDKRLVQITSVDIATYQIKRLEKVSASTINSETKALRLILKSARLWSRLNDDFKPLRESKQGPGRALSQEEERKLFEIAMSNPEASAAYFAALIAGNTSARGCELRRLKLKDVDLVERTMTVRRESTKTDAGCRVIPLNEMATWAFARLLERARKLKSTEPEHYLFPGFPFRRTREATSHKGSGYDPITHQVSWRTGWHKLIEKAGLPKLRFHDLRHHAITKLAEAGIADQTLMSIAGHVSRAMLDHYSHVRLQARRAAVAVLDTVQCPTNEADSSAGAGTQHVN